MDAVIFEVTEEINVTSQIIMRKRLNERGGKVCVCVCERKSEALCVCDVRESEIQAECVICESLKCVYVF